MVKTSLDIARQYLLDYLKDEFKNFPEVRLRFMREGSEEGVLARTETRQYFFPVEWMAAMQLKLIQQEVRRLKDAFPDRGEP